MTDRTDAPESGEWPELTEFQIYLAAISDRLGIDIGATVAEKMQLNAEK